MVSIYDLAGSVPCAQDIHFAMLGCLDLNTVQVIKNLTLVVAVVNCHVNIRTPGRERGVRHVVFEFGGSAQFPCRWREMSEIYDYCELVRRGRFRFLTYDIRNFWYR